MKGTTYQWNADGRIRTFGDETEAARARLRAHDRGVPVALTRTEGRRASILWGLLPKRVLLWWMMRDHRKAGRQFYASHFPLLTDTACKRVAKVLRKKWDHTGVRMLGVSKADYLDFAKRLIISIHGQLGVGPINSPGATTDRIIAHGLAVLEAELGLRDSPLAHRMMVASHVSACLNLPAEDSSTL